MASSVVLSGRGDPKKIEAIIEQAGGVDALRKMFTDHEELTDGWLEAYPDMKEQYPDQWVAWGHQGVIAVAPSHRELLELDEVKAARGQSLLEFVDVNTKIVII